MIVYGDLACQESPRDKLARIEDMLRPVVPAGPGIERHALLVRTFVEAGELMQGIADALFAERGHDAPCPLQDAVMALLMELARAVGRSWHSGFAASSALLGVALEAVRRAPLPSEIRCKMAEGYAFYGLYPEAYYEAGLSLVGQSPRVIGIRSIGASLAAMVAAACRAPPPVTVRPVGPPFRRTLALAPALAAAWRAEPCRVHAVVDEGPGLSGSSFGAVADALEEAGVDPAAVRFFPSHAGDLGPEADPRHRARWAGAPRHVVGMDELILRAPAPAHRVSAWVADLVGEPDAPLEDISGGAWRRHRFGPEEAWPAVNVQQERRKVLLSTASGLWLLKFSGLDRAGSRKLDMARALHEVGFGPPVAGYRHGFLVQRWIEQAPPLDLSAVPTHALAARVGSYLAFRARVFPAGREEPGASLRDLWHMARHNTALALGEGLAQRLARWQPELARLERSVRRIATDNRLQPWEWLVLEDGCLIKTDAVDHHRAHDLIGCQDVAWDIAGAAVELGLDQAAQQAIAARVEREAGHPVNPALVRFLTPCYLAFRLGQCRMAAAALGGWPAEAGRLCQAAEAYKRTLGALLEL